MALPLTPPVVQQFFQRLDFSFQRAFQQVPSYYQQVTTVVPSVTEQNVYPFISMFPTLREWVGDRIVRNIAARAIAVPNKHWELTIGIDRNKFDDDTYGIYNSFMPMYAQQIAEWRDREIARAIEAATTDLSYTGQAFFATAHPVDPDNSGAGTQANKLVGATYDLDGNSGDPLVAFQNARAAMALWKRDADGQQMGTIGNLIMCHPNQERSALAVAKAMLTGQAVNSAAAATSNVFYGKVDVLVNPFLTVTTGKPWYLLCTNRGINPFFWQDRQPAKTVVRTNEDSENVFKGREYQWGVDIRGAAFGALPFLAFRMSSS